MKVFVCLILSVLASNNLRQQVGESCKKNPSYEIQTFDIKPWPFAKTEQYTIAINGVFTDKVYIEQIYMGTKDSLGFWHYTYQPVQKEFTKGSLGNFTVTLQAPASRGSYVSDVQFHHYSFDTLACWQYYYVV